jgi:Domain of unknown function (DUF4413)
MTQAMFEKFEKYWGDVSFLMTVSSMMDPRFKLSLIKFCFKRLYSSNEVENNIEDVKRKVEILFQKYKNDYVAFNVSSSSNFIEDGTTLDNTQPEDDYFSFVIENQTEESQKSDLEVYLEEKVLVVGK